MSAIRIVLADDMTLIREGLRVLIGSFHDMTIVGEASTAGDLVRVVRAVVPDVILMDQDMPGDSLAAIRTIKQEVPSLDVIVLTDRFDPMEGQAAIDAGAVGYAVKGIPRENLAAAIRAIFASAFPPGHTTHGPLDRS